MSQSLTQTIAAYAVGLAAWSAVRAAIGRAIAREQAAAALVLEAGSVLQAGLAAVGLAGGHRVGERGVLIAYLVASVGLLPLLWPSASSDASPWGGATIALASLAVGVVALRALAIWQA